MRDFYKSKRFIVLVTVALILVIVPVTLTAMGLGSNVRNVVNSVLTPVQKLFYYVSDGFKGFSEYFTEFEKISAENEQLKNEIKDLTDKLAHSSKLEEDYEWLCSFLELKREHVDFTLLDATVTGRESGNYMTVFTIDRGTAHGVSVGTPAITADGIVGYVVETGWNWSKIITILSPSSSLGGFVERTGEAGLVISDYVMTEENLCKITYLSTDSTVKAGDRIMSSGYGSVYPRNLLIGTVVEVEADEFSQTLVAYVKPAADLSDIDKIMLITDYDVYVEDSAPETEGENG